MDLLKRMLNKNSKDRPSAEQCLSHTWFKKDRESLQNLLRINKQASLFYQTKSFNNINQDFESFLMAPNYFQNISYLNDSQFNIASNAPKTPTLRPKGHQLKLCYNSFISKGKTVKFEREQLHSDDNEEEEGEEEQEEQEFI